MLLTYEFYNCFYSIFQLFLFNFVPGGSMGEADMPAIVYYNRDRRRSSFTRPMRDPEEILEGLRALKATKGELSRTMSLSGDKKRGSREYKQFPCFLWPSFRSFVRPSSDCLFAFVPYHSSHISTTIFTAFCDTLFSVFLYFVTVTVVQRNVVLVGNHHGHHHYLVRLRESLINVTS